MPLHFNVLANVEKLSLEYRGPTRYNHHSTRLGGDMTYESHRGGRNPGEMIGPPSRTKLVLSNVEHGVTIGEFMMNDQLT